MRTMIKTIMSMLFNKYTAGLYVLLFSSAALAQNGMALSGSTLAVGAIGIGVVGGLIWLLSDINNNDNEPPVSP